ncbi:MAG TPA: hypothetical protein VGM83_21465 [Devosiaceae bacterium]|jgi:hypothetical protein
MAVQRFYERIWPENVGCLILVYLSGCLVSATTLIDFQSNILFWPCHIFIILCLIVTVFRKGYFDNIVAIYKRDWAALVIVLFLLYFIFIATTYHDSHTALAYEKTWLTKIGAGIILGFFLANPGMGEGYSRKQSRADAVAITFCLLALLWISWRLASRLRPDIFLIRINPGSPNYYQMFGDYLILVFFGMILTLRRLVDSKKHAALQAASLLIITIWALLLAQIVGSNNATIVIAIIGGGIFMCDIFANRGSSGARRTIYVLISEGVLAAVLVFVTFSSLPPVRLFNYRPVPFAISNFTSERLRTVVPDDIRPDVEQDSASPSPGAPADDEIESPIAGSSIDSRWRILLNNGLEQLRVNPLFGDLGAEIVTGHPGEYIHSILSVQSHTGIVGSMLIILFLVLRVPALVKLGGYYAVSVFVLSVILVSLAATFFVWVPFWLAMGALLAAPLMRRRGGCVA